MADDGFHGLTLSYGYGVAYGTADLVPDFYGIPGSGGVGGGIIATGFGGPGNNTAGLYYSATSSEMNPQGKSSLIGIESGAQATLTYGNAQDAQGYSAYYGVQLGIGIQIGIPLQGSGGLNGYSLTVQFGSGAGITLGQIQYTGAVTFGTASAGVPTNTPVSYLQEFQQYELTVSAQEAANSVDATNQTISTSFLGSDYTFQYGTTAVENTASQSLFFQSPADQNGELSQQDAQNLSGFNSQFGSMDAQSPISNLQEFQQYEQTTGLTDNDPSTGGDNLANNSEGSVFNTGADAFNSYGQNDSSEGTYPSQDTSGSNAGISENAPTQDYSGNYQSQDYSGSDQNQDMNGSSYNGNDYNGDYNGGGYSGGGYGGYGGGGGYGYAPVVLDIAGKGINIAQLSSSNTYQDVTGDGYKNLTAWAGAGNGVLFIDPTGAGQLTQANQIIFTKWDPSAKSDMQALLDVFDTNHDGALDAGDADFNEFFVMVTNANGTQTAMSLAALGITSINLNANAVNVALPDGSSISGETTFTMTNPSTVVTTTNVAATVTLAVDPNGYLVATTTTGNGDGSETVANVASNADGSLAYERILNTSSNGLSKTLTNLNSGGVVTTIQTDNTVVNGDGSTTETLINFAGGAVQMNGELTAAGTTGSKKLNATTTTISANGNVVTILRDQLGGGWTTQREIDTTNSDGSKSIVISNLNFDGSTSNVTATSVSANGLSRTVTSLVDNVIADSTSQSDVTVVNGATRTESVTDTVGTTVTSLVTTVTQTTANSRTQTTTGDLTDGTTLDLTSVAATVTNVDGSTTTTLTDNAANGYLRDETLTQLSADGLTKITSIDQTGATNAGAPVFDTIVSDNTVINGDGSRTETVMTTSANGTLLAKSITTRAASVPTRTVTVYGNGDGAVTQSTAVTVNGSTGATTATVSNLNADGSLSGETVTTTSAGGLVKTVQVDSTGVLSGGAPVFDHITDDVTTTSGGRRPKPSRTMAQTRAISSM